MSAVPRMPRSIRGQLILALLGVLVAVQCASIWLFLNERQSAVRASTAKDGASRVLNVARELEHAPGPVHATILRAAESQDLRLSIDRAALSRAGTARPLDRLTAQVERVLDPSPERALAIALGRPDGAAEFRQIGYEDDWDRDPYELVVSAALDDGRWLNARIDIGEPPLQWAWPALLSMLLTACAVVAAVWLLVGRIAGPIRTLATAADRFGRGDTPEPLPVTGPTELRRVTGAFNEMAARLTRVLAERSQMLAAIGHDLRSPITAMRLRLELLDDEESRQRLEVCVDEIQSLVQAALALARGASTDEPRAPIQLSEMLREMVADLRETGARATLAVPGDVAVVARPAALRRAIRNIAENAVRYGGEANIAVRSCERAVRIEIEDKGPGIPESDRERVFQPFVRLETSRSRETGGTGLGLAIARAVIESHGGCIVLANAAGGGTRAVISLPAR